LGKGVLAEWEMQLEHEQDFTPSTRAGLHSTMLAGLTARHLAQNPLPAYIKKTTGDRFSKKTNKRNGAGALSIVPQAKIGWNLFSNH